MKTNLAFALFCLLSGSSWILDQFYPALLSGPIRTAAHLGLLALLFALPSLRHPSPTLRLHLELAFTGIALLALPTILSTAAGGQVASLTVILISTFIPVVVVFLTAQTSTTDDNPLRLLLPALTGLGGAALLLPFTWPVTLPGQAWLIAIVLSAILSAFAAIRLHRLLPQLTLLRALAILCASAALVSACLYRLGSYTPGDPTQLLIELLRCLFLEAPILYLLVYLLRQLPPIVISTRYLLVPLVTILESYLIERPHAAWTTWLGILLMAASAFVLIRTSPSEHKPDIPLSATHPNHYT